jgi:predicted nuclease of restriction endonuclease-like (RecB) superfamily
MKKKAATPSNKRSAGYPQLVTAISAINTQMVTRVATVANQALVMRNWMVGAYIVEFEQNGADRAKYGERLLERLAEDLKGKGIKGMGLRTLRDCRTFYAAYPQIRQPAVAEFEISLTATSIRQPLVAELEMWNELAPPNRTVSIRGPVDTELPTPLDVSQLARISWAHFLELIRIDDPWKRAFYENELIQGHWSKRQLQRQIESLLYERTGLSTNKKAVIERARKQEPQESIADVLRDPYILEFTGLVDRPEYSEKEMESALLDHVQRFLLELGRGFCFEARQFRMTEGRKHHRVDLVFYHRLLRCHVLIDLKIRGFQPADAGQMNFYVNWFKANMMSPGDNPPVGILLCSDKDGTEVEFATAGMDQKLFISRYLEVLPSVKQLKALLERDRAEIKALIKS